MSLIYSPSRGWFIGYEPAGFGGVEGWPEWSSDIAQALSCDAHDLRVLQSEGGYRDCVLLDGDARGGSEGQGIPPVKTVYDRLLED